MIFSNPLFRKIFIFVPARHGRRTKGTETAFPQILRSFLPDRLHTLLRYGVSILLRGETHESAIFDLALSRCLFEHFYAKIISFFSLFISSFLFYCFLYFFFFSLFFISSFLFISSFVFISSLSFISIFLRNKRF